MKLVQSNLGIRVLKAKKGDCGKVGIHLLNPTQRELDDAQDRCDRDGFGTIYLHTAKTWPKAGAK